MIIPEEVKNILNKLQEAGFEAYAVGGCARDLLLNKKPKDWDVATNALPEQVQAIFPDSFYENKFGTVSVKVISDNGLTPPTPLLEWGRNPKNPPYAKGGDGGFKFVEVTTYRVDAKYTDKRHPDAVRFTPNLEDDLARRDFTINAMALGMTTDYGLRTTAIKPSSPYEGESWDGVNFLAVDGSQWTVVDPFSGQKDLKNGIIRAVGDAEKRFNEDALRMLRAVRFSVELSFVEQVSQKNEKSKLNPSQPPFTEREEKKTGFIIEEKTKAAIKKNASWLQAIAKERIRDEFVKIIMSERPDEGILLLHDLGLLQYIIPEFTKGFGVAQNKHHIYSIFEHGIFSLKFAAHPVKSAQADHGARKNNLVVRLSTLLHDVAKPRAKRGEGEDATFYNHDIMGARLAARILERLRFDNDTIDRVFNLIRHHMFVYDIGAVTEAGVRRLLARVGQENMQDLIDLRVADRLGSGVPKAQPYRLRHFQYMLARVQHDAISVKMLKINGNDLMAALKIKPGPKIGAILDVLLAEAIEDASKNEKDLLLERAKQLNEVDLTQLRQMARTRIEEEKEEEDKIIKERYWVK